MPERETVKRIAPIMVAAALLVAIAVPTVVDQFSGGSSPETLTAPAAEPTLACGANLIIARPLTPQEAVQALIQSAHDLGTPGPDTIYGAGRLDICGALAVAATITAPTMVASVGGVAEAPCIPCLTGVARSWRDQRGW